MKIASAGIRPTTSWELWVMFYNTELSNLLIGDEWV